MQATHGAARGARAAATVAALAAAPARAAASPPPRAIRAPSQSRHATPSAAAPSDARPRPARRYVPTYLLRVTPYHFLGRADHSSTTSVRRRRRDYFRPVLLAGKQK